MSTKNYNSSFTDIHYIQSTCYETYTIACIRDSVKNQSPKVKTF